jgi:hypothetical protein
MSRSKKLERKRVSVTIIAGVITALGAILAAMIGLFPAIWEQSSSTKSIATSTPVTFSKYDDPSGMFTIEYPSGYSLTEREISGEGLQVTFFLCCDPSKDSFQSGEAGMIHVWVGVNKHNFTDVSGLYDYMIGEIINNDMFQSGTESKLMSSEQKDNGYIFHAQLSMHKGIRQEWIYDFYSFYQLKRIAFDNPKSTFGVVYYMIDHNAYEAYRGLIEHTFSSFVFSPLKINETFGQ